MGRQFVGWPRSAYMTRLCRSLEHQESWNDCRAYLGHVITLAYVLTKTDECDFKWNIVFSTAV
jgi:hypothetical protein